VTLEEARLSVRELFESLVSVVAAISRFANTTEASVMTENMQNGVVSHESTGGGLIDQTLGVSMVFVSVVIKS